MIIYHITSPAIWNTGKKQNGFTAPSLDTVGYIHCCEKEQIAFVLENWFIDQSGLELIAIETEKLDSKIVFENLEGGETLFPHVYGPINLSAIVNIEVIKKENT